MNNTLNQTPNSEHHVNEVLTVFGNISTELTCYKGCKRQTGVS